MSSFIRVTKDNRNRDRGLIAIEAICAVFENQDAHHTEIMTMDGFWYEVVDGIAEINRKLAVSDTVIAEAKNEPIITSIRDGEGGKPKFSRKSRYVSPAISDEANPKRHEEARRDKRGEFAYPKKGYGIKRSARCVERNKDLPSGEGEGRYDLNPRRDSNHPQIGL